MLDIELMDVDLSIVKKEKIELDDYEKESVNILDNFISEHDYNDFPPASMPCGNDDGNVDWLTGFFDEPLNDNMSGLNPPLSDISHNGSTSVSQITSINCNSDVLLDSYPTFSEDYINNTMDTSSLKLSPAMITKPSSNIRNSNPFLSQTQKHNSLDSVKLEDDDDEITVKIEDSKLNNSLNQHANDMQVDKPLNSSQTVKTTTTTNSSAEYLVQRQSTITLENKPQNQQKLLLFMNTPENRAKLAGTNFNIINANLLSKISGQQQQQLQQNESICNINNNNNNISSKNMNLINLKKCVNLNNTVRNEHCYQDTSASRPSELTVNTTTTATVNATLQSIMAQQQKAKKIVPVDLLGNSNNSYGFTRKDRADSQEIDSGYESPTSSSGSSPCSPPIELDRKESCETIQYIDIPPHERQPFYLSEEEKRTLVMEGLPVPAGLPLNKTEERALKKVRRKIKNKISAQESRRKKKEYMESLEKKVDVYATENNILKKKIGSLEVANRSLITQVQKLQALVASKISTPSQDNCEVTEVLEVST